MFLFIWLLTVFGLSIIPASGPETDLPLDKIVHGIMYGITAVLIFRRIERYYSKRKTLVLTVLYASAFGTLIECIQYFLPYRSFSAGDIFANFAGAVLFGAVYSRIGPQRV